MGGTFFLHGYISYIADVITRMYVLYVISIWKHASTDPKTYIIWHKQIDCTCKRMQQMSRWVSRAWSRSQFPVDRGATTSSSSEADWLFWERRPRLLPVLCWKELILMTKLKKEIWVVSHWSKQRLFCCLLSVNLPTILKSKAAQTRSVIICIKVIWKKVKAAQDFLHSQCLLRWWAFQQGQVILRMHKTGIIG